MNNKPKTKKLTISLLCCGRPETTERCLKSIMPLREAVDSELQVIDTGCSKETRKIIEKYADEVFEFTWCNDFAAARNKQIEEANGEWLLYLDDDEFFLDVKEFIKFFSKDEYKKHVLGGYYQRNYLNYEKTEWSDVLVIRMTKITSETRFVGKVHEYIEPANGNTFIFDIYAGHFGYIYESPEDNIKHSMRNIPLLKEMMNEDPGELRWPYQLCQEYRAIGYMQELHDLCQEYIDKEKNKNDLQSMLYRGTFVVGRAMAYEAMQKGEELISEYKQALVELKLNEMTISRLSLYAARQYYLQGKYDECEELCINFISSYEKLKDNTFEIFSQGGIFVHDTYTKDYVKVAANYILASEMNTGKYEKLPRYTEYMGWEDDVLNIRQELIDAIVDCTKNVSGISEIKGLMDKILSREESQMSFENRIDDIFINLSLENLKSIETYIDSSDTEISLYIKIKIEEKQFSAKEEQKRFSDLVSELEQYAALTELWEKAFFERYRGFFDGKLYIPEIELGKKIKQFIELYDKDYKESMGVLKESLQYVPAMNAIIASLSRMYGERQILIHEKEKDPAKFEEMYRLEEAVMNQISELEASGHGADANTTRGQLEAILMQTYGVKTLH